MKNELINYEKIEEARRTKTLKERLSGDLGSLVTKEFLIPITDEKEVIASAEIVSKLSLPSVFGEVLSLVNKTFLNTVFYLSSPIIISNCYGRLEYSGDKKGYIWRE